MASPTAMARGLLKALMPTTAGCGWLGARAPRGAGARGALYRASATSAARFRRSSCEGEGRAWPREPQASGWAQLRAWRREPTPRGAIPGYCWALRTGPPPSRPPASTALPGGQGGGSGTKAQSLEATEGPEAPSSHLGPRTPCSPPVCAPPSTLGSLSGSPGCLGMTFCSLWNP